jgi:hypothetical protein
MFSEKRYSVYEEEDTCGFSPCKSFLKNEFCSEQKDRLQKFASPMQMDFKKSVKRNLFNSFNDESVLDFKFPGHRFTPLACEEEDDMTGDCHDNFSPKAQPAQNMDAIRI